ncbi:MAG TPA: lysostaphin resistance A-like protein [Jatrophihabitantaceae bacterium]|jgi:hypothetical protein
MRPVAPRPVIVALTGGCGMVLLRVALSGRPGSARFHVLSLGTAGVWTAGAVASGYPLPRGGLRRSRWLGPTGIGAAAFATFYAAVPLARRIPALNRAISGVLRHADAGPSPLIVLTTCANAVGEELFFRGALYAALGPRYALAGSTAAYTAATAATRNPALTLAGVAMGALFALQRRTSGDVLTSVLTHLTWSVLMVRFLPPLFRRTPGPATPLSGAAQTVRVR